MASYVTISGAYGRDYKSKDAVMADWEAGKDFEIRSVMHGAGRYISKRDFDNASLTGVQIRYASDRKVLVIDK